MNDWQKNFLKRKAARERFLKQCEIVGDCWMWRGKMQGNYGIVTLENRICTAHRAAYALFRDRVPKTYSVFHTCGNTLCCYPGHLYLEQQENDLPTYVASAWGVS